MQQMAIPHTADSSQGPLVRRLFRWLKSEDRQLASGNEPASDRMRKQGGSPRKGVERSMSHGPVLVKSARDLPLELRGSVELNPGGNIPRKASVGCVTSNEIGRCLKGDDGRATSDAFIDTSIPASTELFDISISDLASHPVAKNGRNADENRTESRSQISPKHGDVAACARGMMPSQSPATTATQPKSLLSHMLRPRRSPSPKNIRVLLDSNKKLSEPPAAIPVPPPPSDDVNLLVQSASLEEIRVEEQMPGLVGLFYAARKADESAGEEVGKNPDITSEAERASEGFTAEGTTNSLTSTAQQNDSTEGLLSADCLPADTVDSAASKSCTVDAGLPIGDSAACSTAELEVAEAGQFAVVDHTPVEPGSTKQTLPNLEGEGEGATDSGSHLPEQTNAVEGDAQYFDVVQSKDCAELAGTLKEVQEDSSSEVQSGAVVTLADVKILRATAIDDRKASPPASPTLPSGFPVSPVARTRPITHQHFVQESMPQAAPTVAAAASGGALLKNRPLTPERLHWGFISPPARSIAMRTSKSALRSRQQRATRTPGPFLSPSMVPASHNATAKWVERTGLQISGSED